MIFINIGLMTSFAKVCSYIHLCWSLHWISSLLEYLLDKLSNIYAEKMPTYPLNFKVVAKTLPKLLYWSIYSLSLLQLLNQCIS